MKISVVTPVYGCAKSLNTLYQRLQATLSTITQEFEIIMVNDASPDGAWEEIKALAKEDARVKGINLSRNFGQHYAITAGLDFAEGEYVVVMDCDLQDQPEEIIKLYNKAQEGYDIVFGKRVQRQDNKVKRIFSKCFYLLVDYLSGDKTDHSIANFSIITHQVLENFKKLKEQHRPYGFFINWLGFTRTHIEINHAKRFHGKSSYSFSKLIKLAFDNIVSQTNKPLILSIKFGFTISFFSALYAIYIMIRYFSNDIEVAGWTSVMVSIYFIGGLLFANMGILGLYIGKALDEAKDRPVYIIRDLTFKQLRKE